jgi:hypothetical protein
MVLKVVTGKILETLKLSGCPTGPEAVPAVRLSKIVDYLTDNLCRLILSEVKAWGQEESDKGNGPEFQIGNDRTHPFRKERGKGWGTHFGWRSGEGLG